MTPGGMIVITKLINGVQLLEWIVADLMDVEQWQCNPRLKSNLAYRQTKHVVRATEAQICLKHQFESII